MNRICSIGRFARLSAELALTVRNSLTKAWSRIRYRLALVAAVAGLVVPLAAAAPSPRCAPPG